MEQETDIFNYCSCISRPPNRYEGEVLPEAVANMKLEIIENSQMEVANGEGNLCKSSDSLTTVGAIEIKLPSPFFLESPNFEEKTPFQLHDITHHAVITNCVLSTFQIYKFCANLLSRPEK